MGSRRSSDGYRYIRYLGGGEELYDHQTDAREWHHLAADPGHKQIKKSLAKWVPRQWADSADTKAAFRFDPQKFTWTHLATGKTISGTQR